MSQLVVCTAIRRIGWPTTNAALNGFSSAPCCGFSILRELQQTGVSRTRLEHQMRRQTQKSVLHHQRGKLFVICAAQPGHISSNIYGTFCRKSWQTQNLTRLN
eukprot:1890224-Pleurochrysis_carterae.AAC.2